MMRIQLGWAAFRKLRRVFATHLTMPEDKAYNQCVLQVMNYSADGNFPENPKTDNVEVGAWTRQWLESTQAGYLEIEDKMSIITIKDFDDLKKRLKEAGNNLVVIDSMAAWADPCKRIEPKLDQLAAEMTDSIIVLKVDVNDCDETAIEYQIKAMPTFVFVKNSKKLEDFTGANYDKNKNIILKLK